MTGILLSTGNKAAPVSERGVDLYQTPSEAVKMLLSVEDIPEAVWEPACGPGAITRVLEAAGHQVYSSDLYNYNWGHDADLDFLKTVRMPHLESGEVIDCIITNPPYMNRSPERFARHAVELGPAKVCMLLRIGFLTSQRRQDIVNNSGLFRVYGFSRRLPMMHRDGWAGKRAGSAIDFAWFVWRRDYSDRPHFISVDWKDYV
ncbi:MAG: class I SAM-dependent methyltransferase [Desulfocapsa sp.]|nr:MAG: class I SAM-dependent methyltransferase [Desulfocapsa sp.]